MLVLSPAICRTKIIDELSSSNNHLKIKNMKSLHKPGMLTMFMMFTFNFLLLFPDTVIAQRDKDEEAIINELTINYSNKIEAALKKDLPRYNKMKSEAEEVTKIKDNEGKKKGM